jgi:hypothetical protein
MKKVIALAVLMVICLHGIVHAQITVDEGKDVFDSPDKISIDIGLGIMNNLPDDLKFEMVETRWDLEPWEVSVQDTIEEKTRKNEMTTADGRPFTSYAVHPSGLIVGTADPTVTKVKINQVNDVASKGAEALVTFQKGSTLVEPALKDIGIYNFSYSRLPFKQRTLLDAIKSMHVYLKIDQSYSMNGDLKDATDAAIAFLKSLPPGVKCSVQSFNTTFRDMGPQGEDCQKVWPLLVEPVAAGGSSIYTALLKSYEAAISGATNGEKSIVVIISDGDNTDAVKKEDLMAARKLADAVTFVYWSGDYIKTDLANIANYEVVAKENIGGQMTKYFSSIATYVKGQMALRIEPSIQKLNEVAKLIKK